MREPKQSLLRAAVVLIGCCVALLQACGGASLEGSYTIDGQPPRGAFSRVQAYSPDDGPSLTRVEGRSPCLVGAVGAWIIDPAGPPPLYGPARIEMSFGDGTGWQDVTADAPRWDHYPYDGLAQDGVTLHTYQQPGEYYISVRVTYYDGDVVTSTDPGGREPLVSVTE